MKTKPNARHMWANYTPFGDAVVYRRRSSSPNEMECVPVAVIPIDDVNEIIITALDHFYTQPSSVDGVYAALTAIGVLPKKRKGRK